jgi:hypothetical protein
MWGPGWDTPVLAAEAAPVETRNEAERIATISTAAMGPHRVGRVDPGRLGRLRRHRARPEPDRSLPVSVGSGANSTAINRGPPAPYNSANRSYIIVLWTGSAAFATLRASVRRCCPSRRRPVPSPSPRRMARHAGYTPTNAFVQPRIDQGEEGRVPAMKSARHARKCMRWRRTVARTGFRPASDRGSGPCPHRRKVAGIAGASDPRDREPLGVGDYPHTISRMLPSNARPPRPSMA